MRLFKSGASAPQEATLEERHTSALTTARAAVSVFDGIVADLDAAAAEAACVAADAEAEIDRLIALQLDAQSNADDFSSQARRIRELVDLY